MAASGKDPRPRTRSPHCASRATVVEAFKAFFEAVVLVLALVVQVILLLLLVVVAAATSK